MGSSSVAGCRIRLLDLRPVRLGLHGPLLGFGRCFFDVVQSAWSDPREQRRQKYKSVEEANDPHHCKHGEVVEPEGMVPAHAHVQIEAL